MWQGSWSHTGEKLSFQLRTSLVIETKLRIPADSVTFTEEILQKKLQYLCSGSFFYKVRWSKCLENPSVVFWRVKVIFWSSHPKIFCKCVSLQLKPLFESAQNLTRLYLVGRGTFNSLRSIKVCYAIWWCYKNAW